MELACFLKDFHLLSGMGIAGMAVTGTKAKVRLQRQNDLPKDSNYNC